MPPPTPRGCKVQPRPYFTHPLHGPTSTCDPCQHCEPPKVENGLESPLIKSKAPSHHLDSTMSYTGKKKQHCPFIVLYSLELMRCAYVKTPLPASAYRRSVCRTGPDPGFLTNNYAHRHAHWISNRLVQNYSLLFRVLCPAILWYRCDLISSTGRLPKQSPRYAEIGLSKRYPSRLAGVRRPKSVRLINNRVASAQLI